MWKIRAKGAAVLLRDPSIGKMFRVASEWVKFGALPIGTIPDCDADVECEPLGSAKVGDPEPAPAPIKRERKEPESLGEEIASTLIQRRARKAASALKRAASDKQSRKIEE